MDRLLVRAKGRARRLPLVPVVYRWVSARRFPGSRSYWEQRYEHQGSSGAGSYGRLAHFKAEVLNGFVGHRGVTSVVEFGCGDGHQLELADYPDYLGLDVSPRAVEICRERFEADPSKHFGLHDPAEEELVADGPIADLALSLDVVYHLVEDEVFEHHLKHLFDAARRFVIVYSSDDPGAESIGAHVRHRRFTDWVAAERPGWVLRERIPNRYPYDPAQPYETSFADFFVFERPSPG
jgi:hypothetical protein